MRYSYPKRIAIVLGIFVAILSGIFQITGLYNKNVNEYLLIFLFMLVIFLFVYVIVYYILNNYIIQKIKPIYKSIQNIDIDEKILSENLENKEIISEVEKDVSSWAKKEKQQILELKQQQKYRKEFLGNVSHELKTPIFNIQGYVLTLLDGGLDDPSINHSYLEKTEKNINRIISIVEDLSVISKLESGEIQLNLVKFDIVKLIEEVIELHEMKAKKKNIKLKSATGSKSIFVKADRKGISQVLGNLIGNSIKYGKENGKTIIGFYDMDDNILIEVSDDGIGIEEKYLHRIFERFFRIDKHRSREQGGTGLGLSIVKHIIDAHNQTIHVRSEKGKETSFTFTLPKAK
ncbi:MAG: sensor histidine kinase [Bacteroidales bacterium]|nr:sensor histidine kinase [Bacteroidales bacterium]